MPFNNYGASVNLQQIADERHRDASTVSQLEQGKLDGRRRNEGANTRATPSSNADIIAGDAEGDMLNDGTYRYELINVTGVGLRWHRTALAVSW